MMLVMQWKEYLIANSISGLARRYGERLRSSLPAENYAYWVKRPVSKSTVLYESFQGRGVLGSPEDIFEHLLSRDEFQSLVHVWAIDDARVLKGLSERYKARNNVRFVKRGGLAYFHALATSRYLITDQEFPQEFLKRKEQIFLHTADEECIGTLGLSSVRSAIENRNIFRNLLNADYIISRSGDITKHRLMGAYRLNNIFGGKIIEVCSTVEELHTCETTYNQSLEQRVDAPSLGLNAAAVQRVIEVVFRGKPEKYVRSCASDRRTKILMYPGGMVPNGITTSALNLLHNIDYERFDVTVICPYSEEPAKQRMVDQLNPKARMLFRDGRFTGGFAENKLRAQAMLGNTRAQKILGKSKSRLWSLEWIRCFGVSSFDHAIDFSGYSPFWGELFLHGNTKTRTIWQHNDLSADAERIVQGSKPHQENLHSVFALYRHFDTLVSVSERLRDINRIKLAAWAPASKFVFARNTLNLDRIRSLAISPDEILVLDSTTSSTSLFQFVTVGRLSPEKNHARLISAFAKVYKQNSDSRLTIIGNGPLMEELKSQASDLGVAGAVVFTGHTDNPYALMNQANVFVLSSDYEGQPMVLLEALVLGLPVITTAFGSVQGALPEGVGTIIACDVDELAEAMLEASRTPQTEFLFDAESYNREVLNEFEALFAET